MNEIIRPASANHSSRQTTGNFSTDAAPDRPDVMVFPPLIPLATLATACALQWLAPLGLIVEIDPGWRFGLGAIIVIFGLLVTSAGRRALLRHGTNVNPSQPTTVLVTEGIFGQTRNPLYIGISVALCGIGLIFALDWIWLLIILSGVILHFAVVRREERYLERKFGEAYRRYRESVPRYLLD
jgi:protein-S-isoprenylcysteine O-methyltransferase Ste14